MSLYSEKLATLKREFKQIKEFQKKPLKLNQKIIYDFVNGVTKNAEFDLNSISIVLRKGDVNKGFMHILLKHYSTNCVGCITAKDILNMSIMIERGIKLNLVGVSNQNLVVYRHMKNGVNHNIVLKKEIYDKLVVTMYSLD